MQHQTYHPSLALFWTAIFAFATARTFAFSTSVSDLLSNEQYAAQARRAEIERVLMLRDGNGPSPLLEPDFSIKGKSKGKSEKKTQAGRGGGFGGSQTSTQKRWSKYAALAELQKVRLREDGVLRINAALSPERCVALRAHILQEITDTAAMYQSSLRQDHSEVTFRPADYYGIEPGRSCRTDLLLSLIPVSVSDALEELFDSTHGKLRSLFEALVTKEGTLYEMAGTPPFAVHDLDRHGYEVVSSRTHSHSQYPFLLHRCRHVQRFRATVRSS